MVSLLDDVLTTIEGLSFTYTVHDIRPSFNMKRPVYPMVVVHEMDNRTKMALIGAEVYSQITYQIDIYAKDSIVSNVPTSRLTIVKSLANTIDAKLNSDYGMTRISAVMLPDDTDATVLRYVLRYTGFLDVQNDVLYRRGD